MLRKWIHLVLVCALLLGLLPAALAEAAPETDYIAQAQRGEPVRVDIAGGENSWYQSAAYVDGQVVLVTYEDLQAWRPGDQTPRQLVTSRQLWGDDDYRQLLLFTHEDKLYGFVQTLEQSEVLPITMNGDQVTLGEPIRLELQEVLKELGMSREFMAYPMQLIMHEGRLFLLYRSWEGAEPMGALLSFDFPAGGQPTRHNAKDLRAVASYKDGQLIGLQQNEMDAYDHVKQQLKPAALSVYDPAKDAWQEVGTTPKPFSEGRVALLYTADNDTLYLSDGADLYYLDARGQFALCAYLTPGHGTPASGALMQFAPGLLLHVQGDSMALRTVDPAQLPTARLTVYGWHLDDAAKQAIAQMGGVPVTFLESRYFSGAAEMGQALVSGEDNIDIFVINTSYMDIKRLQQKGYCMDLSGDAALAGYVDGLYPALQSVAKLDGQLLMVPLRIRSDMIGFRPHLFEELGLTPPTTFFELCDFLQRFNDEFAQQRADLLPIMSTEMEETLFEMALTTYGDAMESQGKPFSFTDPLLRRMLERLEQLKLDNLVQHVDWSQPGADDAMMELYEKPALVDRHFSLDFHALRHARTGGFSYEQTRGGAAHPLMLVADEGMPFALPMHGEVAAINPRSAHRQEALQFLSKLVANLQPSDKALMSPGMNDEILNPNFEAEHKRMQEGMDSLARMVEKAEGAEKTELEQAYQRQLKDFDQMVEQVRVRADAQSIQEYRKLAGNNFVRTVHGLNVIYLSEDISSLISRYKERQINLDQFLQEAEGKLRLMRLENE